MLYDRAHEETIVTDAGSDKIPRNKSHKYLSIGCFTLCYTVDNYVFIKCYENFFLHFCAPNAFFFIVTKNVDNFFWKRVFEHP